MVAINRTRRIVLTGLFAALAVLLSGIHFPVGPTKVFPFQHMVNALAGVLIGPWCGALAALIRNVLGTGTIFAFPGGIPGAIVVGLFYHYLRRDWATLLEPVGTGGIGVLAITLIFGPLMGKEFAFVFFFTAFMVSSIPGSILGYFLLKALKRTKVLESDKLSAS